MIQRMNKTFRPDPLGAYTGDRSTLRFKPKRQEGLTTLRPRQQRTIFDAAQISPMLQVRGKEGKGREGKVREWSVTNESGRERTLFRLSSLFCCWCLRCSVCVAVSITPGRSTARCPYHHSQQASERLKGSHLIVARRFGDLGRLCLTPRPPPEPQRHARSPKRNLRRAICVPPDTRHHLRKEYLKQSSSTAGRRSENIVRTVPVPWCQSGGSDTYRRHPSRKELHDAMNSEHAKAKREFAR